MLFLQVCEDPVILKMISYFKAILNLLCMIIPIILIVMLSIDGFRAVVSTDENASKKSFSHAFKRIMAAVVIFLIPTIVNLLVSLMGVSRTLSDNLTACWTRANKEDIAKYQIEYNKRKCSSDNEVWNSATNTCEYQNNGGNNGNSDKEEDKPPATATIYVGDSRTVGMCNSNGTEPDDSCVAKVGMGLSWLKNTAKPSVDTILKNNPNTVYNIIIALGVNDLGNKSGYVSTYNELASAWSKHKIIIVSVTPVDEQKEKSYGYTIKNSAVDDFNTAIKNGISSKIKYCNISSSLTYSTTDGLHYDSSTYKKIYAAINNCK